MRVMRFALAVVLAPGSGFLLVGIAAGVALGAALLVVATRLIDPRRVDTHAT